MESPKRPRFVTQIVQDLDPKLENYFNKLLRFTPIYVRRVHESSTYKPLVLSTKSFSSIGMFYIFLIRKEMYNLIGKKALDGRVLRGLKELVDGNKLLRDSEGEPEDIGENECPVNNVDLPELTPSDIDESKDDDKKRECSIDIEELLKSVRSNANDESENDVKKECHADTEKSFLRLVSCDVGVESAAVKVGEKIFFNPKLLQAFLVSYRKYEDPREATLDIIEDIFIIAMFHGVIYGDTVPYYSPELLNMDNIKTVLKHVTKFDRRNILLNPDVSCEYFSGTPNVIQDDTFLLIRTSESHFQVTRIHNKKHMYQLLFYALGVFVKKGKEMRKFKIYNPLLGFEYFYEIPHLDFNEFLTLVKEVELL